MYYLAPRNGGRRLADQHRDPDLAGLAGRFGCQVVRNAG